jgi:predicted nucleic acid-binding protein
VVVTSDVELEELAVQRWLAKFEDQALSLCDAVSFAVMTARRVPEALALDHRFAAAGFRTAP